jgi:hypothetical protein
MFGKVPGPTVFGLFEQMAVNVIVVVRQFHLGLGEDRGRDSGLQKMHVTTATTTTTAAATAVQPERLTDTLTNGKHTSDVTNLRLKRTVLLVACFRFTVQMFVSVADAGVRMQVFEDGRLFTPHLRRTGRRLAFACSGRLTNAREGNIPESSQRIFGLRRERTFRHGVRILCMGLGLGVRVRDRDRVKVRVRDRVRVRVRVGVRVRVRARVRVRVRVRVRIRVRVWVWGDMVYVSVIVYCFRFCFVSLYLSCILYRFLSL